MQSNNGMKASFIGERNARIMAYAKNVSTSEVRYYFSKFTEVPQKYYMKPGSKIASSMSEEKKKFMDGLSLDEQLLMLAASTDSSNVTTMTTFNVSTTLRASGYSVEVIPKIEEGSSLGATLGKGIDKTDFPNTCLQGYAKFYNDTEFFYCPIEKGFMNTNYFKKTNIQKPIFNLQIVEMVSMLSTFFEMSAGAIKHVSASETGTKLLSFGELLHPNVENSLPYIMLKLTAWIRSSSCPDSKGWDNATLHGFKFGHSLYNGIVVQLREDDSFIGTLSNLSSFILATHNDYPFLAINDDGFAIVSPSVRFPTNLLGQTVNLEGKKATLEQAYYSLVLSRGFRGVNRKEKGANNRTAYFACNVDPELAETSYFATNIERFVRDYDTIVFITEAAKSTGLLFEFLNAITILDFKGMVLMADNNSLRSILTPVATNNEEQSAMYKYGRAEFYVHLASDPALYCVKNSIRKGRPGMYYPSGNVIILDMRTDKEIEYQKGNMVKFEQELNRRMDERYLEWTSWVWPVVGRAKLSSKMVTYPYDNCTILTGVELHNMVMWIAYNFKFGDKSPWWYNVTGDHGVIDEICAASIMCNIMRCMRSIYRVSPYYALKQFKYRVPSLRKRGLGKLNVSFIHFHDTQLTEAMAMGPLAVLKLFQESEVSMRASMLRSPEVRQIISTEMRDKASGTISPVLTASKIDWTAGDEEEFDGV